MELFLEAIKEFNYKEIWFNRIKNGDFIDYFCSVDNEERKYLECYYMLFLKNNCESLEDEDVIILNYIDTKIDELLNRSKKELLSFEEIKFLSDFLGNLLLYNKEVSEDKIVCYVNNCYLHNKELGLGTDLVILLKYVFDYLNNYNNANIKFMLKSRNFMGGDFANFVINMETLEKKVFVVREYYDNFIDKYDSVPLKTFNYMLVFQTASLLHEFMHYKQSGLNFRKPLTEEEDILRRELDLIWEDSSFYKKNISY